MNGRPYDREGNPYEEDTPYDHEQDDCDCNERATRFNDSRRVPENVQRIRKVLDTAVMTLRFRDMMSAMLASMEFEDRVEFCALHDALERNDG